MIIVIIVYWLIKLNLLYNYILLQNVQTLSTWCVYGETLSELTFFMNEYEWVQFFSFTMKPSCKPRNQSFLAQMFCIPLCEEQGSDERAYIQFQAKNLFRAVWSLCSIPRALVVALPSSPDAPESWMKN